MIIKKKQTHTELVQYEHATCFYPIKSTFEKAIKNNFFRSWPGFTPELVKKNLATPVATTQGHLNQEKKNLQNTKMPPKNNELIQNIREYFKKLKAKQKPGQTVEEVLQVEIQEDSFPESETPNIKTNDVVYAVINRNEICTAYTDLTGRFPMRSSRGNQYISVEYHYDGNYILGKAIKDRKSGTLTAAW